MALTVGIPVMSAVAAAAPTLPSGIRLALLVDGAVTLLGALAVHRGLREPSGASLPR
ncbi:hypothetical protein GCM10009827_058070 [Dactylosporangium maewongense]|uniref:Uncharacterized protein n=1 Tax=Dactylosporangium maewongense TaxID=634393 RepID=A0ABN2B318_9ACTN